MNDRKWIVISAFAAIMCVGVIVLLWPSRGEQPSGQPSSEVRIDAPPNIVFYGDSYVEGTEFGGQGFDNFTVIAAGSVGAYYLRYGAGGAGYAKSGNAGLTFPQNIAAHPAPAADLTVVIGSRNDLGEPIPQVVDGLRTSVQEIQQVSVATRVLIIGPIWVNGSPPEELSDLNDAMRQEATSLGVNYYDALAAGWFADAPELISADGVHPSSEGHAYLGRLLAPVLLAQLDGVP